MKKRARSSGGKRALTAREREAAGRERISAVMCRHIDPSLHGDGSDLDLAALCATPEEAAAEAERLQAEDRDAWNRYSVRAPTSLLEASREHRLSDGQVRRILAERRKKSP
jgi:hypothetical protein